MNRRFWTAVMAAGAICAVTSCDDKEKDIEIPSPAPEPPELVLYATGSDGTSGVYWCNDKAVTLASPISETAKWTRGKAIEVVGDDVYVAGYENKSAILWKNGVPTTLTDNTTEVSVNDLLISGNDIYVAGADHGAGVIWKNGIKEILASYGEIRALKIDGADFYAAGYDNGVATVWKNGKAVALTDDNWNESSANGICIYNGKIYAAGYHDTYAAMWEVSGDTVTETALTDDFSYAQCRSIALDTATGTVYCAGNDGQNPCYWVSGQKTVLASCSNFGTVLDAVCINGAIYMGGSDDNKAVVWIDGVETVFADSKSTPSVYAICVVEK